MVTALTLFFELRGHLPSGARWFERALAADTGAEPTAVRARRCWGAAHVAVYGEDFETAATCAPQALALAEQVGDEWAMARALNTMGYIELWSDPVAGRVTLTKSVQLGEAIGDQWAIADGLKMLSLEYVVREDLDGLDRVIDELRDVATKLGNGFFLAWCDAVNGLSELHRGEFDAARRDISSRRLHDVGRSAIPRPAGSRAHGSASSRRVQGTRKVHERASVSSWRTPMPRVLTWVWATRS